jgi:hypothetical protein
LACCCRKIAFWLNSRSSSVKPEKTQKKIVKLSQFKIAQKTAGKLKKIYECKFDWLVAVAKLHSDWILVLPQWNLKKNQKKLWNRRFTRNILTCIGLLLSQIAFWLNSRSSSVKPKKKKNREIVGKHRMF